MKIVLLNLLLFTCQTILGQQHSFQLNIEFLKDFEYELKAGTVHVVIQYVDDSRKRRPRKMYIDTTINNQGTIQFDKIISGEVDIMISSILHNNDSSISRYFYDNHKFTLQKDSGNVLKVIFPIDCAFNRHALDKQCPKCRMNDMVVPIRYGLLRKDDQKVSGVDYISGGCGVSECDPSWYCKRDEERF